MNLEELTKTIDLAVEYLGTDDGIKSFIEHIGEEKIIDALSDESLYGAVEVLEETKVYDIIKKGLPNGYEDNMTFGGGFKL